MIPRTRLFARTLTALSLCAIALASPALADRPGFQTPSGNITCFLSDNFEQSLPLPERPFVCLVFEADWAPPEGDFGGVDVGDCGVDETRTIELSTNGPAREYWSCHGDVFWPIHGTLAYGSTWSFFDFSCAVETTGVSCENAQGNGFTVRRADRSLF